MPIPVGRRVKGGAAAAIVLGLPVGIAVAAGAGHGALDTSFGNRGVVTMPNLSDTSSSVYALAVQRDGKLVAAGGGGVGFIVARFNRNGSVDRSFGRHGVFRASVPSRLVDFDHGPVADADALVIEPDGKLLVGGDGFDGSKLTGMLVRLDANGSLDKSFGSGGSVFSSNGFGALVRRSDGKIVVLGGALARYEPDGTLDKSFGSRGTAPIRGFGEFGVAGALVLQPDGKLVVSGDDGMEFSDSKVILARYNANGSPDRSFGSGGKVMNDLGRNYALAIQPDGKLVAAGGGGSGSNEWEWVLSRYNANGSLDRSFGAGGVVRTPLKITMGVQALVIQHDGKLVAAGCDANTTKGNSHDVFQLIRYNANGSLDPTFGRGGEVTTAIPANPKPLDEACVSALAIQPDGKLVAGGKGQSDRFDTTFALARYQR